MTDPNNCDDINQHSSITSPMLDEWLNDVLDPFESNNIPTTADSSNLSDYINLSSQLQSFTQSGHTLIAEPETTVDINGSGPRNDLAYNVPGASPTEVRLNESFNENLQIIAEPKAVYRPRYASEIDKDKNRANRFIHTENEDDQPEYPTIKIPSWCHPNQQLYVRVTLVTVISGRISYHCIHPYEIATSDNDVIRDQYHNSLFFPITKNEFAKGEKSFRIIIVKKKQDELKSYGHMRLFDLEQYGNVTIEDSEDPKEKIALYHLSSSQFVFTITQLLVNIPNLVPTYYTSVKSRIMTEDTVVPINLPPSSVVSTFMDEITCVPQQGNWNGGDDIIIILPNPIRGKEYMIHFHFGRNRIQPIHEIIPKDTKTILFRTPSCPIPPGDENLKVLITIQENKSIIASIDFHYITPIKRTIYICSRCQKELRQNPPCKKRGLKELHEENEEDSGESLVSQMNDLSIEKTTNKSRSHSSSISSGSINEKLLRLDTRLREIKVALEIFIRTNDPSELFRRTDFLLSKYEGNSSPLHDAIQHGHTELALAFIKQIMNVSLLKNLLEKENENGETPLLIAVKVNEWKLIECILKSRSNLAKQKDKDGNNLFHLLAKLSEDKGAETIKRILTILPSELKMHLLKEKNQTDEKPMDIAQSHKNSSALDLLIDIENDSE